MLQKPQVIAAIFSSGVGGSFQYGFQIAAMTSPSLFIKDLVNETCVQRYNVFLEASQVSLIWSFLVSIFSFGGLFGTLVGSKLATKYGRKTCLLLNNLVAISGAVLMLLSKAAMSFEMIMAARLLYGVNAGVSLSVHTMYLVECTPKLLKASVGMSVSTFVAFGKFCSQLLGISELLGTADRWPWLLGFNAFTALLQLVTLPFLPESPCYLLLQKQDRHGCEKAMRALWGDQDCGLEVEAMLAEQAAMSGVRSRTVMELLGDRTVRWQLLTVVVVFTTLQLCGINAVYFYSFEVFLKAGIQEGQLRYAALGTGLCEVFASITCFMLMGGFGKKVLLYRGYFAMTVTLGLLTITLYLQSYVAWMPYCSMALIFTYICFFSCGPAAVSPPLPGVVFTQAYSSAGYTVACTCNWLSLFLVGMLFPLMVEHLKYFCFIIFLCFCLLTGLYVLFNVPETKNRNPMEVTADFQQMHSKTDMPLKSVEAHGVNKMCQTKF